jgi:hypothetical protein
MRGILWNREIQKQCTRTYFKITTTPNMDSYKEKQKQNLSNAYELSDWYWVKIRRAALEHFYRGSWNSKSVKRVKKEITTVVWPCRMDGYNKECIRINNERRVTYVKKQNKMLRPK